MAGADKAGYHLGMVDSKAATADFITAQLKEAEAEVVRLREAISKLETKADIYKDLLSKLGVNSGTTRKSGQMVLSTSHDPDHKSGIREIEIVEKTITSSAAMMKALEKLIQEKPGIDATEAGDKIEPHVESWRENRSARKLITDKLFELTRTGRANRDDNGRYWPVNL